MAKIFNNMGVKKELIWSKGYHYGMSGEIFDKNMSYLRHEFRPHRAHAVIKMLADHKQFESP